jgi:hypothetical protein
MRIAASTVSISGIAFSSDLNAAAERVRYSSTKCPGTGRPNSFVMSSRHCGIERPTNRSNMSSSVTATPNSFSICANTRLVINSLSTSTPSQSKITKPNLAVLTWLP